MIYFWTSEITVVFIENVIFPYAETLRVEHWTMYREEYVYLQKKD